MDFFFPWAFGSWLDDQTTQCAHINRELWLWIVNDYLLKLAVSVCSLSKNETIRFLNPYSVDSALATSWTGWEHLHLLQKNEILSCHKLSLSCLETLTKIITKCYSLESHKDPIDRLYRWLMAILPKSSERGSIMAHGLNIGGMSVVSFSTQNISLFIDSHSCTCLEVILYRLFLFSVFLCSVSWSQAIFLLSSTSSAFYKGDIMCSKASVC